MYFFRDHHITRLGILANPLSHIGIWPTTPEASSFIPSLHFLPRGPSYFFISMLSDSSPTTPRSASMAHQRQRVRWRIPQRSSDSGRNRGRNGDSAGLHDHMQSKLDLFSATAGGAAQSYRTVFTGDNARAHRVLVMSRAHSSRRAAGEHCVFYTANGLLQSLLICHFDQQISSTTLSYCVFLLMMLLYVVS